MQKKYLHTNQCVLTKNLTHTHINEVIQFRETIKITTTTTKKRLSGMELYVYNICTILTFGARRIHNKHTQRQVTLVAKWIKHLWQAVLPILSSLIT